MLHYPQSDDSNRFNNLWLICGTIMLLLFPRVTGNAQSAIGGTTPLALSPGAPAGSYALSGLDNVNLFNGNLNFQLPLLGIGGRGTAGYTVNLPIERKWRVQHSVDGSGQDYFFPDANDWGTLKPGYGPGVLQGRRGGDNVQQCEEGGFPFNPYFHTTLTRLTFTSGDGTEYELRDQASGGQYATTTYSPPGCTITNHNRGKIFVTADGSAATFVSADDIYDDALIINGSNDELFYPTGDLMLRDGSRYHIVSGKVSWVQDRNGNRVEFAYDSFSQVTTITDSLNRHVTISYANFTTTFYDQINFDGFGAAPRSIKVWYALLGTVLRPNSGYTIQTFRQLFPELNAASSSDSNPLVISAVELPNGRRYQLYYNPYAELARVEMPSGGAFEYDYGAGIVGEVEYNYVTGALATSVSGVTGYEAIYRRVTEKRVYPDGSTLKTKITFSRPESFNSSTILYENLGYVLVDQLNAGGVLLSRTTHYQYGSARSSLFIGATDYAGWKQGREYQTDSFDIISGSPVLRHRLTQTWSQPVNGSTWPTGQLETVDLARPNDPQITQSVTILTDTNQLSKQTFSYDRYCNQTDVLEYDHGAEAGVSSTYPVRHVHTNYLTTNPVNSVDYTGTGVHIRGLPSAQQIYSINQSSGAETLIAQSETKYDETPLLPWYGTVQGWNDVGASRGNPTKARSWVNPGNFWIEMRAQFDQVGNISKSWDANNNQTEINYSSAYHFAYATQISSAVPDSTGQYGSATPLVATSAYDFSTGLVTSTTDTNGQITNTLYEDVLDRPTRVIRAVGTAAQSQDSFGYQDDIRTITATSDLYAYNDNLLKSETVYDGLGRTTETRKYEDGTNYVAAQKEYDALGRIFKTSNPFRQAESALWTITVFDGLGRVNMVTSPDSSVTTTSYTGNGVTVTDQIGKKRKSVSDALGRVKEVYEDPSGLNHLTTYTYDALDNLTTVTQGSQTRTFVYNSLRHLTSASNPESGTTSYQYDNNGNLTLKTDARPVSITYAYDALNRNTTVDYSDTIDINPDITRVYDGATNGRGRVWYNYAGGDLYTGSNVERKAIDSYDELGRPRVQRQRFKLNGTWGPTYQIQRSYNLAGGVMWQTYPSGHTVNYAYDNAGRTSSFTGYLGDGSPRTYTTGIIYSSLGGMAKEQFGTDTPVYNKLFYNSRGQLSEIRLSTIYTGPGDTDSNRGAIINHYSDNCLGMCGGSNSTTPMPDNNGNLKKQSVYIPGQTDLLQQYAYDSLNRISWVREISGSDELWKQTYAYDRYGNRRIDTSQTSGFGINSLGTEVEAETNRLYAPGDLVLQDTARKIRYDGAGNQTKDYYSDTGNNYNRSYDAENRLNSATKVGFSPSTYKYNADGHRVRRIVGGMETWQIYGVDGELVAEYPANGVETNPQKEYGYRNGQLLITAAVEAGWGAPPVLHDNPLAVGVTGVQSRHITELRTAIDALRTHLGLSPFSWQHSANSGDWIKAEPILEMRTALDQTLGAPPSPGYSPGLGQNLPIMTVHIQELRNRVLAAWITGSSVQINWLVTDHLGTPRIVMGKTGALSDVKRHDYLPFGEELVDGVGGRTPGKGYVSDNIRQKFSLKERDTETGLDYLIHRYRSSTQGRFTSADDPFADQSEGDPQSWNLYTYAGNNPLIYTDPSGLWKWAGTDNNGNRLIQWEKDDDVYSLSRFLEQETGVYYYPSDLKKAYFSSGEALGPNTIVDASGVPRGFTNTRGVVDTSWSFYMTVLPAAKTAQAAGGLIKGAWRGLAGLFARGSAGAGAKGVLSGSLAGLTQAERSMVQELLAAGKNVQIIPRATGKTADFVIDGAVTELKTLTVAGPNTLKNAVEAASEQGQHILVDARNVGIGPQEALQQVLRAQGNIGGLRGRVTVLTGGGTVTY